MSRSGYTDDDYDHWAHIKWRGQVASAIRGKRGQAFLRDLRDALDAMPNKRLIANDLVRNGDVCAIGALGQARGIEMSDLDPDEYYAVAKRFGIAHQLAQEIVYMNDEGFLYKDSPESRWCRMRAWVSSQIKDPLKRMDRGRN